MLLNFEAPLPDHPRRVVSCEPLHRTGQQLMVVRLQHLWAEFCQNLVTRSALGNITTMGRVSLPAVPGIFRPVDVQRVAWRVSNGRPPPWHRSDFTLRVAGRLALANHQTINNSIGAVSPIADLVEVRNYIVHPNRGTSEAYMRFTGRLGVASKDPAVLLTSIQPGGITLFKDWVFQLQDIAAAAVR